jgi:hypothetical protein
MAAIFGLGELLFLAIEVIGTLLFGKRRKRVPPPEGQEKGRDSHTVTVSAPSSATE